MRVAHTCRCLACVRLFPHLRVAHTCRRLACVRLLRTADHALIARRSQTSQDDVCARGWRIHAAVWHVCGYCAPRTMPSLHVVRSHHKTTSPPPSCRSDERARGCRQSQRNIFILGLILQGSIHPLGNSTLVSGGGTFGRAGYYARWHVWAIAIVARLANNDDARSVIATKGVIKREPTLWRSAGPRRGGSW